ncbi:MAG TPA: ABC transporter permease subunit [Bdellovibrionales bacterium]|nr:ABC transporter permease subunit [Bdellovibrionales bacterium]
MRGALTIAGKDLRNIFASPLFYVLAGICSIVWSLLFLLAVEEFANRSLMQMAVPPEQQQGMSLHFTIIARHLSLVNLLLVFSVSALTMRLFTEEKKNRTFDLLLTSPVTATEIALGKWMAGTVTAWALVLLSALYPLSILPFAQLEWGLLFSSYFGLLLLVMVYVAVGVFASSLTESAVLAVIMALVFNIMLWFVGAAGESADGAIARATFDQLNVGTHFIEFVKGSVSIAGIVYFASATFLFTLLTERVIESFRWR